MTSARARGRAQGPLATPVADGHGPSRVPDFDAEMFRESQRSPTAGLMDRVSYYAGGIAAVIELSYQPSARVADVRQALMALQEHVS